MVYKTLILPVLEYGDIIYDCLSAENAATLQKLQNACLKHILQISPSHLNSIYPWQTVEYLATQRKQHVATQMYRIDNDLEPQHLQIKFKHRADVSTRVTRITFDRNFEIPEVKLEMCKRNFVYRGIKTWYDVPAELKFATDPKSFRIEISKVWKRDGDVGVT